MFRHTIDYAVYLVIRTTIAFVQALPLAMCERLAELMATLFTSVIPIRRKVLAENLRIAFPEITPAEQRKIAWGMWRHLLLMVMEIAHTPRRVHRTNWRQLLDVPHEVQLVKTLCTTRPSVIISGHFGNFELGGYLLGLLGFPTHTVARTLDNQFLDRFVNDFRGRTGQYILPKNDSGEQIEQLLAGGGSLTLLGDQAAGNKRGCWVPFFSRPASTHKAVALFSLSFDAPTMVVGVRRCNRMLDYHIDLADVVDPAAEDFEYGGMQPMTEWYTRCLEQIILSDPRQYWWIHRRWKGKMPEKDRKRLERRGLLAA